jgi:aldehyde dehydrogenase (NAD+)/betaine-aldehyde dehydrogenase
VRVGAAIRANRDHLIRLESLDTGKPLAQATADVDVAARYFEYYAHVSEAVFGATIPLGDAYLAYTEREPYGVTAHIAPWNYPAQMVGRTIAPALAAGNCAVLKPAEEAPLTPLAIARLAVDAGLPRGVFNVVPGLGEEAGAALAGHPGVDHVSFTGSTEVGILVARAAGSNIVPVTVELGGKCPNIVFADADLERAVPVIVRSIIQNCGQTCSAGARLLVEEACYDRVVTLVAERFAALRVGRGLDDPDLGPLISARQRDRVLDYVEVGRGEGRLVAGGGVPDQPSLAGGYFVQPTFFADADPGARIAQEEVFGPFLVALPFRDREDAVRIANGTPYGLVAGVWTNDPGRAHRTARELRAGQVYINGYGAGGGVELPFGGVGQSGYGREKGYEGLLANTRSKTVVVTL